MAVNARPSGPAPDTGADTDQGAPPDTMAVALDYDPIEAALPKIVASGKGYVAEQILSLAFANGVKVRQDADLVQILSALDLDSDIPPEAFVAVAEILAYVYNANQQMPQTLNQWLESPERDTEQGKAGTDTDHRPAAGTEREAPHAHDMPHDSIVTLSSTSAEDAPSAAQDFSERPTAPR